MSAASFGSQSVNVMRISPSFVPSTTEERASNAVRASDILLRRYLAISPKRSISESSTVRPRKRETYISPGFLIPRLAPAIDARALEPPSWPSNAELIEAFCDGGKTTVVAVYLLGIIKATMTASRAAPKVKPTINFRRRERIISMSNNCRPSLGESDACKSRICSSFASSFMWARFLELSYQPLARIPCTPRFEDNDDNRCAIWPPTVEIDIAKTRRQNQKAR